MENLLHTILKYLQNYYYREVNTMEETTNKKEKVYEKECERLTEEITGESDGCVQCCDRQLCQPCNRFVPFCCTSDVAAGFLVPEVITEANFPRLVYNVSCLRCIVEPCRITCQLPGCPSVSPIVYQVKIVGCIPFRAEAFAVTGECGGLRDDKKGSVCCSGSVCVDQPICIKDTLAEAKAVCDALTPLTCDDVKIKSLTGSSAPCGQSGTRVVTFKGIFELPSC